jgi:uncharacterized protein YkwD
MIPRNTGTQNRDLGAVPRRRLLAVFASASVAALLRPVGPSAAPRLQRIDPPLTSEELEVVQLMNGERASLRLVTLTVRNDLVCAARGHARDIVDTFARGGECAHEGSNRSSMVDRVRRCKGKRVSAEILGCGRPPFSARRVLEGWRGSEGHWKAITDPAQRSIGVAHAVIEGGARPRGGPDAMRTKFGAWVAVFDRA